MAEAAALLSKNPVNRTQSSIVEFFDQEQSEQKGVPPEESTSNTVSPSSLGTNSNLRPFRCDECCISFRTSGHLARHKRSKSHIDRWKPPLIENIDPGVENSRTNSTDTNQQNTSSVDDAENRPYRTAKLN